MPDSGLEYPRRIVIDDTDPRITYDTGEWDLLAWQFLGYGISGDSYNGTLKGTTSASASFTFTFEGEYFQIKGAKGNFEHPDNSTTDRLDFLPTYTCQIDGKSTTSINYSTFAFYSTNLVLCEQSHLARTNHTISMNVSVNYPITQPFWLDSIEYAPLGNANLTGQVLKVDSSDASCVYHNDTGDWHTENVDGDMSASYNGTGSSGATMSFRFNGTSVSLYSMSVVNSLYVSTTAFYRIDGGSSVSFEINRQRNISYREEDYPNTMWMNQHLFTISSFSDVDKEHEMVIVYPEDTSAYVQEWLYIDYFLVGNNGMLSKENVSRTDRTSGTGAPPATSKIGEDTSKGDSIGETVGGVVGSIFALVALVGLVWFLLKKRKEEDGLNDEWLMVTPFRDMVKAWTGGRVKESRVPDDGATTDSMSSSLKVHRPGTGNAGMANFVRMKRAQREAVNDQAVRERDSGIRYRETSISPPVGVVDRLPPAYTLE
ncbi:hypothetical protein PM082_011422 [Marasmius tenuissimus]|nr:hypothetical protein PM082_011422 [Marasmius tenuissimus]